MKIIALVKFNDEKAIVFDEMPGLLYSEHNTCLIGEGGIFYDFLIYERPGKNWRAFAGRKFELPLKCGGVVECSGQWWDGHNAEALEMVKAEMLRIVCATPSSLCSCYVYGSRYADKNALIYLLKQYKGPVYEYWDYEKIVKGKATRFMMKKYRRPKFRSAFAKLIGKARGKQ